MQRSFLDRQHSEVVILSTQSGLLAVSQLYVPFYNVYNVLRALAYAIQKLCRTHVRPKSRLALSPILRIFFSIGIYFLVRWLILVRTDFTDLKLY